MALEDEMIGLRADLKENTAALKDNSAAHLALAKVATAAAGGKVSVVGATAAATTTKAVADKLVAEKPAAAAAKPAAAAAAKPAAKPKAKVEPTLAPAVSLDDLRAAAKDYLGSDDPAIRDAGKANISAAFKHLGAGKLTEIESDEDRARLSAYIAFWTAGLEVNFEDIDAKVAALQEADGVRLPGV